MLVFMGQGQGGMGVVVTMCGCWHVHLGMSCWFRVMSPESMRIRKMPCKHSLQGCRGGVGVAVNGHGCWCVSLSHWFRGSSPESVNKKSPAYQHLQGSGGHMGVVVSRHGHWSVCLDGSWDHDTSSREQS